MLTNTSEGESKIEAQQVMSRNLMHHHHHLVTHALDSHSVAALQQHLLVQAVQGWMVSPTCCLMVLEILYYTVHLAAS